MPKPLLSLKRIKLSFYRDNLNFEVIRGISLNAYPNEFLSIIGPSGCGKSSLIRIISGLLKPTSGKVLYKGSIVRYPPQGISLIFQDFALFPWLTALENVKLSLSESGLSEEEKDKRSTGMLETVGLKGFESIYPYELSGGMRQRVGVARALVSNPELLLMDEPFSSLDALTAEQLRVETRNILKNKATSVKLVVMVSHNVEEVVEVSDRIIALTKAPSSIVDDIGVKLAYPRDKQSKGFYSYEDRIYKALYTATE